MNAANRYQGREGGCSIAQGTRDRGPQKPSDQRHRGVGAIAVLVTVFQHQSVLTYHRIESIDGYFDFWFGVDIFCCGFGVCYRTKPAAHIGNGEDPARLLAEYCRVLDSPHVADLADCMVVDRLYRGCSYVCQIAGIGKAAVGFARCRCDITARL